MKVCAVALTLLCSASAAMADNGLVKKTSSHSVSASIDRLESIVKGKGFTVIARVNHAAAAGKVDKSLRPTELLLFGNPKVGTLLMESEQSVGLDLPVKVLAWEDADGKVWLGYNAPQFLAERHGIADRTAVVEKMTGALKAFTDAAAAP